MRTWRPQQEPAQSRRARARQLTSFCEPAQSRCTSKISVKPTKGCTQYIPVAGGVKTFWGVLVLIDPHSEPAPLAEVEFQFDTNVESHGVSGSSKLLLWTPPLADPGSISETSGLHPTQVYIYLPRPPRTPVPPRSLPRGASDLWPALQRS